MLPNLVRAAAAAALVLSASTVSAKDGNACLSCVRTVPLATPVPLLPYDPKNPVIDYRPAINATGTTVVFERQFFNTSSAGGQPANTYLVQNLFIADLKTHSVVALAPTILGSARADWCYRPAQAREDGPITFSKGENGPVFTMPPRAGATPVVVKNTDNSVYPTWYPGFAALAIDTSNEVVGPSANGPGTQKVDVQSGTIEKLVTGTTLWAGFPSVNWQKPNLLAFAGQQLTLNNPNTKCSQTKYDQTCNYVYISDSTGTPPRIYPLDRNAPVNMYDPDYQGRAPTWSPDGKWIAFESNRACIKAPVSDGSLYQIYIQDSGGLEPARPVTDCKYNAQHAKWYRHPVRGRNLLVTTVLAYPGASGPGLSQARAISSLDVTAFVAK